MRFSLKVFLLLTLIVGAVIGIYGRRMLSSYSFGCQSFDLWTPESIAYGCVVVTRHDKLQYCVLRPRSFDSGTWSTGAGHISQSASSDRDGFVGIGLDGFFIDGKRITLDSRIYVFTVDRTVLRIDLTDEEYAQIADGINLDASVWKKKVEPVILEEYQRGRRARGLIASPPSKATRT